MRGLGFCCPHAPYYIGKFAKCQEVFRKYTEFFRGGVFLVKKIKKLCDEQDKTLFSLEKECGFGNGTINKWDKNSPSIARVMLVAKALNTTVSYLIGETDEKSPPPGIGDGLTEKDVRVLDWFNSLPPETRKAILTLGGGPEDLGG